MIAILRLGREFGYVKLETSVAQALVLGCTDVAAIRHLLMSDELQHAVATTMEIGALAAYGSLIARGFCAGFGQDGTGSGNGSSCSHPRRNSMVIGDLSSRSAVCRQAYRNSAGRDRCGSESVYRLSGQQD